MKLRQLFLIAAGALAAVGAPIEARAQQTVALPQPHVGVAGAVAGRAAFFGGANNFEFIAAAPAFGGEMVKNSPYSAEAVTETQQTLADGNKISRTNSSKIYRDSQGRTRREQTISALGPWSSAGEPIEMVFIDDPVAGVNYVLNSNERTAQKTEIHHFETIADKVEGARVEKDVLQWKSDGAGGNPPPPMVFHREFRELKQADQAAPHDVTMTYSTAGANFGFADDNVKTESLGKQIIEGVEAEGTRTTITIPAGQIGNERPIETVSESWYSPQLQTLVLSKQNDPRMGETTYRLTGIQLVEPLPAMFEVPAGYTIQEAQEMQYFERKIASPNEGQTSPGR